MKKIAILLLFLALLLNGSIAAGSPVNLGSASGETAAGSAIASSKGSGRQKVALVLSGGGAKGMAHIGALKVIESIGIPIDIVVGTSMGSIAGGLYAIGYTPEQLDSIVRNEDWMFVISDQTPRSNKSIAEREMNEKYLLSVPIVKDVKKELSGGIIKGRNVSKLLSEFTIGYHDSIDFNSLPIPFACVAQDLATGKEVHFHSGVLAEAMRASMAIPAVFTPVREDSMVLIDGGMVNNYPVDVARRMGADIVIGVDVQNNLKQAGGLDGAGDILWQLVELMGKERYEANKKDCDVHIKVDVDGYSAASFSSSAIDTLIRRGQEAAEEQSNGLWQIKQRLGLDSAFTPKRKAVYPYSHDRRIFVNSIIFDGLDVGDQKWLLKRCLLKENSEVSMSEIEKALTTLCSTLEYSTASFSLPRNTAGGYDLHFHLTKKFEKRLNIGLRFDSEETAAVQVNMTANFRQKTPTSLSLTARLGLRYSAGVDYNIEVAPLRRIGMSYLFQYNDIYFKSAERDKHTTTFRHHQAQLSFSDVWHRNIRYGIGLGWETYDYDDIFYPKQSTSPYDVNDEHFFSYFARIDYENYDDAYFPKSGLSAQADYTLYTDNFTHYKGHAPISVIRAHLGTVIPITNRFSILPDAYGRFLIGDDIPYAKLNCIGGDIPGRYLNHQLPFVGINSSMIMDNALLVGSIKLRQRMGAIHYLTLTGNYALNASKWQYLLDEDAIFGCGITYGMDSMFGPLEATFNYDNSSKKLGFYINLGYKF